ncbi:MAG: hypothetical protein JKY52_12840 [Flavobacteriales bacterium]|nr:hypothetical protein [Flavobacteriales bacterium]
MNQQVTPDNLNRLAVALMEHYSCTYLEAIDKLEVFTLVLECDDKIAESVALQAALLTCVNSGKRAFLGGVYCIIRDNIKCLVPGYGPGPLNDVISDLGAICSINPDMGEQFVLTFGQPATKTNSLEVVCNGWQGGVCTPDDRLSLSSRPDFNLGGVAAGAIAVGFAFLQISGVDITAGDTSQGISLWRPDLPWHTEESLGPPLENLPSRLWTLGLGHLGQAYLWVLGSLPYPKAEETTLILQDYDRIEEGNYSSGLLSEIDYKGQYKTRIISDWLEQRGFTTIISERKYDDFTVRVGEEPYVAISGFDSADARTNLDKSGFDLVVDCGLGGNLMNFDSISINTFPNAVKSPLELWGGNEAAEALQHDAVIDEFEKTEEECGILAAELASKAISASFIGALSASLVVSEILRGLHKGTRYDRVILTLRSLANIKTITHGRYSTELVRNGYHKASL